tara:strand:+ start:510 stop:641 length:132 start_codon:yes stop_codon:yes gene_type:complete
LSHQSKEAPAFLTRFDLDAHHNKPEEHKEEDEYQSLEEALLGE